MREICLSGSGEGAVQPRPYLIPEASLGQPFNPLLAKGRRPAEAPIFGKRQRRGFMAKPSAAYASRVLPSNTVDGEDTVAERPSALNNQPSTALEPGYLEAAALRYWM